MPSIISTSGSWGRSTVYNLNKTAEEVKKEEPPPLLISLNKIEEEKPGKDYENDEDVIASRAAPEETGYTTLPYLYSSLFGTILEDATTQMRILVEGSNGIKILKTKSDWDSLKRMKFGVEHSTSADELSEIDLENLGSNVYKINKLDSDRKYVTQVLNSTYVDLCLKQSFKTLVDSVKAIVEKENYRVALTEEDAKNRILRRELGRQLRQLRNHVKSVIYDAEVKVDELRTQVEDSVLNSACRDRYIENWQRARTEQHVQTIVDAESVYSDKVEYFKIRTDHEQRVHLEVEMLINIAINDTLEKVENLMDKYDVDIEAIELRIQIKKNDYQNMKDKRIELENTIEKHEKLMNEWIQFKKEREEARQYREKMTKSAITVQAWWRGLLVRRQLGPYKVAKKKAMASDKKK